MCHSLFVDARGEPSTLLLPPLSGWIPEFEFRCSGKYVECLYPTETLPDPSNFSFNLLRFFLKCITENFNMAKLFLVIVISKFVISSCVCLRYH